MNIKLHLLFVFAHVICFSSFCQVKLFSDSHREENIEELLQEFFLSETVYAQEKNEFQITSRPSWWKDGPKQTGIIPLQFEYGFTDRLQVGLLVPYYLTHTKLDGNANSMGNAEVELLYAILKENIPFALSVSLGVGFPTVQKEKRMNEEEIEWEPAIIVAKQIGNLQLHAAVVGEFSKNEFLLNYNAGMILPFRKWRFTLEVNTENDKKTIFLTPGAAWKGWKSFEFGMAVSRNISNIPIWGTILMITHEFSLVRK